MATILVDAGLNSLLEILENSSAHVLRNRADEAYHVRLQLVNCSRLIVVHVVLAISPQKEVQGIQIRGVRGPDVP